MKTTRKLVEVAIEQDLLDPDTLLGDQGPSAPEGYELERLLGRGGCGEVYLARDTRLDRPVAVKFLHDATQADVERFRREARFTARLNDPAIVQVYALGETDGRSFIAMQFIDGPNLADARLDRAQLLAVIREVARALRHAHAEGVVHRDIKPANILLDREGRAFLTDFGIARSLDGALGETMSREGQIMGTPGLMSPEQARGDIHAVDARSDIYALGATLYHKLTGRYPFQAASIVDVLHAVIHDEPPLPRSLDATIPRALENLVVRCLRKAREERYQSAEEVIDELDRILAGTGDEPERSAWFRRLVGQHESAPTAILTDDLAEDPYWNVGLEVVREIAAWDANLYRVSGSLAPAFERLDDLRARLDRVLETRPDLAWARFYRGVALSRRGRLAEAAEDMERAIDRVNNLAGAYFELGRVYIALYLSEQHLARRHITAIGVEHGLTSARSRLEQAALAFSEARRLRGDVPAWLRQFAEAVRHMAEGDYPRCVSVCDEVLDGDPDVESVWKLRGDALRLAGEDPFESYERALAVRRSYFEALYAMAEAHMDRGRVAEARAALERASSIHPEFVEAVALLARTYLVEARENGSDGAAMLTEAHAVATRACALDTNSYDATVTLAEIALERGRREANDGHLAEAVSVLERADGLNGCMNRVNLLRARTLLERARLSAGNGADPRPKLTEILTLCDHEAAQTHDNAPWRRLREEAERELEGCS